MWLNKEANCVILEENKKTESFGGSGNLYIFTLSL